jgi:hypothetical protein
MKNTTSRRLLMKIFLRLISGFLFACAVLLAAEAYFQWKSKCHLSGIAYDSLLGWRLRKDHRSDSNPNHIVNFNSSGFRDRNHSRVRKAQTVRILILGDSYTAGLELSDSKIFTRLVENQLNANTRNFRFEVMNVSVPAWGTDQQYLYLKNEGLEYSPDFVVLMVAPNDIRESFGKKFLTLEDETLRENGLPSVPLKERLGWELSYRSCLFQEFQERYRFDYGSFKRIFALFPVSFPVGIEMCNDRHLFLRNTPVEVQSAQELFQRLILEMDLLCKQKNTILYLSIIPTKMELDRTLEREDYVPGKIAGLLQEISRKHSIRYLNLYSELKSSGINPLDIFISDEYHLNEFGHRFVAEKLVSVFLINE